MSDNPLSSKVGLDTTEFKTGVAQMNRELRVLESSFRANAASLGNWGQTASGLEMRIGALTKQLDVQQRKVEATRKEYERIKTEKGETSRAAQDLEIKLNKETETLGKMQVELNDSEKQLKEMTTATDTAGKETQELGRKQDETAQKTNNFGQVMSGLGGVLKGAVVAIAGLAAAVVGLAIGFGRVLTGAMDSAGAIVDMSNKTGIGVERLQELTYAGQQLGVETETITGAMARLTRSMDGAREQQEAYDEALASGTMEDEITVPMEMASAFNQLGVSVTDSNGALRDNEAVFADALAALGKVTNETERDALAMQIFGKSAQELNPLIKAGADEIAALSQEARDMGAVIEEEDVNALEGFGDVLTGMQAGLKGTLATLVTAFIPGLQNLAGAAQEYLGEFGSIVRGANGDLGQMASGVGGLLGKIVADIAAQAPQLLQAGLGILQGIITAIVANLPTLVTAAISIVMSLVEFLISNLPMLIQAGITLLVTLATGIAQALPELIPAIVQIIPTIITILLENLPILIDAALQLILALANGLIAALPILIQSVPVIVTAIFDALIVALPMIGEAALQLIMTLIDGIMESLPMLGEAAGELIGALVNGIEALANTILSVGENLVMGVWDGIQARAKWFESQVLGFFRNIVDKVKETLGIESPSTVMADTVGEPMAEGVGVGFVKQLVQVRREMQVAMGGLSFSPHLTSPLRGEGQSGGGLSTTVNLTMNLNVGNVGSGVDVREMAYEVAYIAADMIQQRARR